MTADVLSKYWAKRSQRERHAIFAASAVLIAIPIFLLLLGPGLAARNQLAAQLPLLRSQLDDMRQQQKEIVALRRKLNADARRTDLKALLQTSAARTSFVDAIERLEVDSSDKAAMRAAPVAFDDWLTWVENLQREFGIRLDACRISGLDLPGMVRIEASFSVERPFTSKTP
jgi:general secretion pathway protein M